MDRESLELLQNSSLFSDLNSAQLEQLLPLISAKIFNANEYLIREGEIATSVYVICDGEVEVLKKESNSEIQHHITYLNKGDVVGELAIIDQKPRSASVRILKPTKVLAIKIADLQALAYQQMGTLDLPVYYKIISSLARNAGLRLRNVNSTIVETLKTRLRLERTRVAMGNLLVILIALVSFYTFALNVVSRLAHTAVSTTLVGVPIISIFACATYFFIKKAYYPLSFYGLNCNQWQRALWEGIIFSIPVILLIVLIKWLVINSFPEYSLLPLFEYRIPVNHFYELNRFQWLTFILPLIYLLLVPVQELMYRGLLQGSLEEFLTGRYKTWLAIFVANFIFSMTHLHVSLFLALVVFPVGLFWGWLYARHRTLIGVTVSHLLIGGWVFFVMGISTFLMAPS